MADHAHEVEAVAAPEISDLDLRTNIEDLLWSLDSIRVTKPQLQVAAHNGQATVSGVVNSPMMRAEITEALQGWPVELFILDDAAIQNAAAYALAMDARTSAIGPGYRVQSHDASVDIMGKFTSEEAQAIREVVGEVAGVKAVAIN
jgi:osmotically-inducible protein OsmY